jgi:hypothetical protein
MGVTRHFQFIRNGEDVSAGVTNRAPREILAFLEYLEQRLNAAELGGAIYHFQAAVEPDAKEGQPVYWNPTTNRYERAIVGFDASETDLNLIGRPSSRPAGVVSVKLAASAANILLCGRARVSLDEAVDGIATQGQYWLSAVTAGKLTKNKPAIAIPVLELQSDGYVLVRPQIKEVLSEHQHFRYELACRPAGHTVPPVPSNAHTITVPNTAIEGWLPADHASFGGKAPEGAMFGYNFLAAPKLQASWPPLPIESVYLDFDRGEDKDLRFSGVSLGVPYQCVVNADGIWWMTDCYGDVPWPTAYSTSPPNSDDFLDPDTTNECPRQLSMRLTVYFTRPTFLTETSVVTSLSPAAGSLIRVLDCDGQPASRGDLQLALDIGLIEGDSVESDRAVAVIGEAEFNRTLIVRGLVSDTPAIILDGSVQTVIGDDTVHRGLVRFTAAPLDAFREIDVQLVRVEGVTQEYPRDYPSLGFPAAKTTFYNAKLNIPTTGIPTDPRLQLRFRLAGDKAGTLPELTLQYQKVPKLDEITNDKAAIPNTWLDVGWLGINEAESPQVPLTAPYQYIEAISAVIPVDPGDMVVYRVTRTGTADSYPGIVLVLTQAGVLSQES